MSVLVTGGTGFLGKHVARAFLGQGVEVKIFGRNFETCSELLMAGAKKQFGDLRNRDSLISAAKDAQIVIHSGALSAPWGRKEDFHSINVDGTRNVIAACAQNNVERLVYISSPSVIFSGQDQFFLTEKTPYPSRFTSEYALTKKLGEDLINAQKEVPAVILRPKALFGPGDTSLLPRLLVAARSGKLAQIGTGQNLVDLTYVANAAQAVILAAASPNAPGKTYTITNHEHVNLWALIKGILKRLKIRIPDRAVPLSIALMIAALMELRASRTGLEPPLTRYTIQILARNQTYDTTAAQYDLLYKPQISIDEAVERTLAVL